VRIIVTIYKLKPACEVRIASTYKHIVRASPIQCGTFNTPSHDQHYWAWFVDINDGWSDNGNLIAGGPMNIGEQGQTWTRPLWQVPH